MMGKKINNQLFYLEVHPALILKNNPDHARKTCEAIKADIQRHVDDVEAVHVECSTDYVCEHCGYPWTEDSENYNGGCCEEDEAAAPETSQ